MKKPRINLTMQDNSYNSLRKRNEIEKKKIDLEQERLTFDKETKDRVDISKKEYLELLEKAEYFESLSSSYKEIIDKIIKSLINNDVPDELLRKAIFEKKFDINACIVDEPMNLIKKIMVIYKIPYHEYNEAKIDG